jgi:RNA polymerase sigma-70 factor (ECF subfamily)
MAALPRESAGDPAAQLFAGHYARLAGWIRRLVDDDDTAHDIASETFTRVLTRWRQIDDPAGYLYVVAANLVRDHWRRTRRERRVGGAAQDRARCEPRAASSDVDLRTLITALPERLRISVLLHYYADFSIAEVARALGRPEGTVKSDLHAARALLRSALEGTR